MCAHARVRSAPPRCAAALLVSAGLACSGPLPHPTYAPRASSALTKVDLPPPPGRVETLPPAPPRAVWVDGEWAWRKERWAWSPGRWVEPPPGATFVPWAFVRAPDGTLWYAPGIWQGPGGAVIDPPSPISIAHVEAVEVVNASGEAQATGPPLRARPRLPP